MSQLIYVIPLLIATLLTLWFVLEIMMRLYVEKSHQTDFYGSIPRDLILQRQKQNGVQIVIGPGWFHLGWIADPQVETYQVEKHMGDSWRKIGKTCFGSFLCRDSGGHIRVWAVPKKKGSRRLLGEVTVSPGIGSPPLYVPRITGAWKAFFRPNKSGYYINDHTIFQDVQGAWRLVGITSQTDGDFNAEKYFAVGVSPDFPPDKDMIEADPIADFGEQAWAPCVIQNNDTYHIFWSPYRLHQMTSADGVHWENHSITLLTPYHKFFRDPFVLQVAENQWLLYSTARGLYFSQVDIYQSFDLCEWQYIRTALKSTWGSERNSPFASTESPSITQFMGRYYLTVTYNNDSFFWPGILLLFHKWIHPASYNDTLVFHSENPYDFGIYRGRRTSSTLVTRLEAHAPEIIHHPQTDRWYITTAGWPWVTKITSGEVAFACLEWIPST